MNFGAAYGLTKLLKRIARDHSRAREGYLVVVESRRAPLHYIHAFPECMKLCDALEELCGIASRTSEQVSTDSM